MTDRGPDHELADQDALGRIREALDETLFVEAGAGTGKTHALVERFVALVLGGRPIERLVAITFTEKAAAELRERVRSGLEKALAERAQQGDVIRKALDSLDRAQVSTIHSFCQSLLYSFAAEAGIDPSFTVQDEVMARRRFEERWRMYLEGLAGDPVAMAAIDRVLGLGLTTGDLQSLASELAGRAELVLLLEEKPLAAEPPQWPGLAKTLDELEALPLDRADENDELRKRVERVISLVSGLVRPGVDREAALALGARILETKFRKSNAAAWGGATAIREVRDTAKAICDQLNETLAACRADALGGLLPIVVRFVKEDARARGSEGVLTFDDLILRARDLLRDHSEAAKALRSRYDALLVDEFQDTDPLQVDIARSFATDPATGTLEPGRLFLVGDPKQSIYRFRRADMAIYSRTLKLVKGAGGELPELALNRRSRKPVLDWVNAVFEKIIGVGDDDAVQPPYRPIHQHREGDVKGPGVAWLGGEVSGAKARDVRRTEASAIAAQCRAALDEAWQVAEKDGTVRPAAFKDIAVLIPARTILSPLERALADAGVPYRVEGGSVIYQTQEVCDLANCLAAIDNPADEVAVVAALRSAAFACSDVDLARHKAAGGRFSYVPPGAHAGDVRVADALETLAAYHEMWRHKSLAALVESFVAERGLVEIGILDRGDRNTFRRMRFVVEQARAFEANGPERLRAFVTWLQSRSDEGILDDEGGSLDDDEDAVRLLTVHGAKGLEFPIVFVAGLGSAPGSRTPALLADHSQGRVAVSIGAKKRNAVFNLGPVDDLRALEKAHASAEYARVLYVAATRARDHLIVSLFRKKGASTECGARRLIEAGACELAEERPAMAEFRTQIREPLGGVAVDPPEAGTPGEFARTREDLVKGSQRQRYTSATALKKQREDERKEERAGESEPWARGRGGTRLGRAVHAAIQSVRWDADAEAIAPFARAQAVAEAIPDRHAEVARLVARALASKAAQRARSAGRALREAPFAVQADGQVLEGFVDLLIETAEGIEIVDWKTDQVDEKDVPARLKGYEPQASLYVYGVESATGRQVSRVTYVFVSAGVEASPGDPAELREKALRVLAGERE